ncbi:MAG TPA: winged helix DNA-binding protein [Polyangiaceae bacterium]
MIPKAVPRDVHVEALAAIAGLRQLTDLFQARREQLAETVGLTEHQWEVLEQTTSEHFMPSMFARSRQSSPAAVSKTLRQLIDKELVSAAIDENDGRQRRYELTPKGRRILLQLRQSREAAVRDIWMKFEPKRLRAFTEFAMELSEKLEQYARRADKKQPSASQ